MNELSSLGLILLLALLAGHAMKFARVPEVTGYIMAGVALGPSALGWLTHENLNALSVFSEVTLGLVLFSVGSVFQLSRLRKVGRRNLYLTMIESATASLLVGIGMFVGGLPWQLSLLLGAIAIETAVASTLMVVRECKAAGPLTETLMDIIAMNNIFCLVAFTLAVAVIELTSKLKGPSPFFHSLYVSLFPLLWQLFGSVALGFLVGLLLAYWASKVVEHGELLILLAGSILLCVGLSLLLELSPMLSSLAVGGTMVNLSDQSRRLFETLSQTDPPLYAIFFVIAGADLDLSLLGSIGVLGAVYLLFRAGGKFLGARLGAARLQLDTNVQNLLGFGLMTQAGLAIGLILIIRRYFPEYSPAATTIVLSSIVIYEMIGPISTRFALFKSGEAQKSPSL